MPIGKNKQHLNRLISRNIFGHSPNPAKVFDENPIMRRGVRYYYSTNPANIGENIIDGTAMKNWSDSKKKNFNNFFREAGISLDATGNPYIVSNGEKIGIKLIQDSENTIRIEAPAQIRTAWKNTYPSISDMQIKVDGDNISGVKFSDEDIFIPLGDTMGNGSYDNLSNFRVNRLLNFPFDTTGKNAVVRHAADYLTVPGWIAAGSMVGSGSAKLYQYLRSPKQQNTYVELPEEDNSEPDSWENVQNPNEPSKEQDNTQNNKDNIYLFIPR